MAKPHAAMCLSVDPNAMLSLVIVSTLFLTNAFVNAYALDVIIHVVQPTTDESVLDTIRRLTSSINADNRYVSAEFVQHDCNGEYKEKCQKLEKDSVFVAFKSLNHSDIEINGHVRKSAVEEDAQRLFMQFTSEIYLHRSEESDIINWWKYQLTVPLAEDSEQVDRLIYKNQTTFVLYYEPEGYDNFAAYYAFGKVFSKTDRGLAVNCSAQKTICEGNSITDMPTIIAYENGLEYKRYLYDIDANMIRDWIKTIQRPVITNLTQDAVPYYRDGVVPGFEKTRPLVIMYFGSTRESDAYKNFKIFARGHHGEYHLTELIAEPIKKWAHQPAFVAMKPLETITKANTLYENITYENMADFIAENLHPSVHRLTDIRALFTLLSLGRPVVIFYDTTKIHNKVPFETLAANYTVRSTVAAFAISEGLSMPGLFFADLLQVYIHATPSYVLFDPHKNCFHKKPIANDTEIEIEQWLRTVTEDTCIQSFVNIEKLAKLQQWELRDELRRAVEGEASATKHEEL